MQMVCSSSDTYQTNMSNLLHIFHQLRFFAWLLWKNPFLSSLSTFEMRKWRWVFFISILWKLYYSLMSLCIASRISTQKSISVPTWCAFIFDYASCISIKSDTLSIHSLKLFMLCLYFYLALRQVLIFFFKL